MPKAYLCFEICFDLLEGFQGPNTPGSQLIFEVARFQCVAKLARLHSFLCFGFQEASQFRLRRTFRDFVFCP